VNHAFVTRNFTLGEFIVSDVAARMGIDNNPTASVEANLRNVLIPAMQSVRDLLGVPVLIKSGYRSLALNRALRSKDTSQHVNGQAADFIAPAFGSPRRVADVLVQNMARVRFDQLIWEGGWVHISFAPRRRNEVLTAHFTEMGVSYTQGLA